MTVHTPNDRAAIPWFPEATYQTDRHLMSDALRLPATWEAWHSGVVRQLASLAVLDIEPPVRVDLDVRAFLPWCARNDLKRDAAARGRFVAEVQAQRNRADRP